MMNGHSGSDAVQPRWPNAPLCRGARRRARHAALRAAQANPQPGTWKLSTWSFVLSFLASSAVSLAAALGDDLQPRHGRVTWSSDPATAATISWSTRGAGEMHRVNLRPADAAESHSIACQQNGAFGGSNQDYSLYYHHAQLTGLRPDTSYQLTLESDGRLSPQLSFRTAPSDVTSMRLISGGDSRSGHDARRNINRMMAELVTQHPSILAIAHGGDFVMNGRNLRQWGQWLDDHELTVSQEGRLLPVIPTRGNHDRGPLFNQVFGLSQDHKNYYGVSFGSLLRLVTLNTEASMAGDQSVWLQHELSAWRAKSQWLAVQYHRAAFPAVKWPSGAYTHWVPIFEQHRVDLVCESDGHAIKRTPSIRGSAVDPTGVVYIGEGGLGVAPRMSWGPRWYLQPPGKVGSGHHIHLLTFSRESLAIRTIKLGGEVFDDAN